MNGMRRVFCTPDTQYYTHINFIVDNFVFEHATHAHLVSIPSLVLDAVLSRASGNLVHSINIMLCYLIDMTMPDCLEIAVF